MRTTLTLEPDVAERLQEELERTNSSLKQVINEALRRGLGIVPILQRERYRVLPHSSAFLAGIDTGKLNQLADELEAIEFLNKANSKDIQE